MALSLPKLHWFLCDDEQLSQFYCCGTLGLQQQSLGAVSGVLPMSVSHQFTSWCREFTQKKRLFYHR